MHFSSTLPLLKIELLDFLACFLLLHGGFIAPPGSLLYQARSLAHRMSSTSGNQQTSWASRGQQAKSFKLDSSPESNAEVGLHDRRTSIINGQWRGRHQSAQFSLPQASPSPVRSRSFPAQGGGNGSRRSPRGLGVQSPFKGRTADSSHDAGGGGGRQPEGQVRSGVLGVSRDTVFGQGRAG